MRRVHAASKVAMAVGLAGLAFSLTALIRDRGGSEFYLIAGLVLLVVGAFFYWFTTRRGPKKTEAAAVVANGPSKRAAATLGYASLVGYFAVSVLITVVVVQKQGEMRILFLVWIIFVLFFGLVVARSLTNRKT